MHYLKKKKKKRIPNYINACERRAFFAISTLTFTWICLQNNLAVCLLNALSKRMRARERERERVRVREERMHHLYIIKPKIIINEKLVVTLSQIRLPKRYLTQKWSRSLSPKVGVYSIVALLAAYVPDCIFFLAPFFLEEHAGKRIDQL